MQRRAILGDPLLVDVLGSMKSNVTQVIVRDVEGEMLGFRTDILRLYLDGCGLDRRSIRAPLAGTDEEPTRGLRGGAVRHWRFPHVADLRPRV